MPGLAPGVPWARARRGSWPAGPAVTELAVSPYSTKKGVSSSAVPAQPQVEAEDPQPLRLAIRQRDQPGAPLRRDQRQHRIGGIGRFELREEQRRRQLAHQA